MNWFTSDGHFSHIKCIFYESRKFSQDEAGVLAMNEAMVSNWNSVVKPEDTVYYLGDFSLSCDAVRNYVHRLNGYKILILGNHDYPHPANKKSRGVGQSTMWANKYMHWGFDEIHMSLKIRLDDGADGILVRLYHMPYRDETDPKQNHPKWRLVDDGIPLICGHVHSRWKLRLSKSATPQVNVGVDMHNMTPVAEHVVLEYFRHLVSGEYRGPELKNLNLGEADREDIVP